MPKDETRMSHKNAIVYCLEFISIGLLHRIINLKIENQKLNVETLPIDDKAKDMKENKERNEIKV